MICPGMSSGMIIPTASRCVKKHDPCIIERLHNFDFCQLLQCYENVFANNCDECGKIIGIDSKDLSYKEKHWHEACFLCNKVKQLLLNQSITKNFSVSDQSCGQAVWFKGGQDLLRAVL